MKITKAVYQISAVKASGYPKEEYPKFMFIGRSNVGKSSFINALTNRKNLAYTSSKPGKTQTLNFYNINDSIFFVDVPGYGYAKQLIANRLSYGKMIEDFLEHAKDLKIIFLIVDVRHAPSEDDVLMYEYLKHFDLPVVVIATKVDKIGKTLIPRHRKVVSEKLKIENQEELLVISSETGYGIEKVWELIESKLES
ncbi:MAG: YihA family ribosome biogenesis GTP-binding protein [Bacilli bacterium]|nr:YihA family ribosome biogenesis GTP-binding protein [Bacilli bacterium]MBQ8472093.1 YihA family ribosome biogenesis GTP-binding protein [Bacilli bacterium]